jgi:RimJ/RimL family protein N-acetyltransferase
MITIRHSKIEEREKVYQWLCLSDTTPMHMGPPDFPGHPVPDWEQFLSDFEDFYFLEEGHDKGSVMIIENDGEEIGCVCHAGFHLKPGRAELDIWMRAKKYCGRGLGPGALRELVDFLAGNHQITRFLIRPSEKNHRAIAAYEKIGFKRVEDKESTVSDYMLEKYFQEYGAGDYGFRDTAVLTMELK